MKWYTYAMIWFLVFLEKQNRKLFENILCTLRWLADKMQNWKYNQNFNPFSLFLSTAHYSIRA